MEPGDRGRGSPSRRRPAGAAVSSSYLWISRSELASLSLERLDLASGRVAGSRSTTGGLWGVSEAGACHVPLRHPFFSVIFRFHLDRITPAARYRRLGIGEEVRQLRQRRMPSVSLRKQRFGTLQLPIDPKLRVVP